MTKNQKFIDDSSVAVLRLHTGAGVKFVESDEHGVVFEITGQPVNVEWMADYIRDVARDAGIPHKAGALHDSLAGHLATEVMQYTLLSRIQLI